MRAGQSGYSLVELLVSTAVTLAVTGAAGLVTTSTERVASEVEREQSARMDAQFTLDWIVRTLEQAGSRAYGAPRAACGGGNATFDGLSLDPDGDGVDDDVQVRMDVNPPNGWLGGRPDRCDEAGEDVVIALDREARVVTRQDVAMDTSPVAVSGAIVHDLRFTGMDAAGRVTRRAADVAAVGVALTTVRSGAGARPREDRATVWLRR